MKKTPRIYLEKNPENKKTDTQNVEKVKTKL